MMMLIYMNILFTYVNIILSFPSVKLNSNLLNVRIKEFIDQLILAEIHSSFINTRTHLSLIHRR